MSKRVHFLAYFIILFFWLPLNILPQQKNITLQRIDIANLPEIHCYLTIADKAGNSILGLTENEIEVFIDGIPQKISILKSAIERGEYLAIALLFDRSGSMKNALNQTKEAAIDFIDRMSVNDLIAILSFDDLVRIDSNFTKDQALTESAIKGISIGKDTALYDAIKEALNLLQNIATKRQAIVIFSDGKDTKSKLKREEVLSEAKNKGIPLFSIGLGTNVDDNNLIELSAETGGNFFKAANPEELLLLYQTIAEQLKNQYILSFTSTFGQDEKWHDLKISFKDPGGQKFTAEREYIASTGPGVSRKIIAGFKQKTEMENVFLYGGIGAFFGLLAGLLLILTIKFIRPEISLFSLLVISLVISAIIFGGILGALLRIMG